MPADKDEKPKRLYFKTYLKLLRNSVGTAMFRNLYVATQEEGEFDALDDGANSCAFYVSGVLVIFKMLTGIHGTVASTQKDLLDSGWKEVGDPQAGDVLVWEAQQFDDGLKEHMGFSLGHGEAVSTSWTKKVVVQHSDTFEGKRRIAKIYHFSDWS